ncbi:MAG: hypothetical protein MR842_00020 [Clostridiales bacterium]|nr:hypothetical protein [Clostridiales bacterium]
MKLPITQRRVHNHLTYAWWQYVLLVCVAVFGWNLIYTTTRYRSPEPLKVEWYGEGYVDAGQQAQIDALLAKLHGELFPDMEEVTFTPVAYDDTYGDMQLFVWASAGQGDLYTLSAEAYKNLASGGAMLDLQPYIDDGTLRVEGIDLKNGYVTDAETGKRYLMGIPIDSLTGLESYGIAPQGKVMSILVNGGNTENTMKLMKWLLENMRE